MGSIGDIVGLHRDNGKENGNYRDNRDYIGIIGFILGLYRDNGKENGITIVCWGYTGINGKSNGNCYGISFWGSK